MDEGGPAPRVSVRRTAIEVLCEVDRTDRFVDEVLAERFGGLEARDRRLLQEVTYGTLRHRNTLDRILKPYLKMPPGKQRPHVRWALRSGAYQLVYLLRVPAHAAVNQTLEGLKGVAGSRQSDVGFVNAILHRLVDDIAGKDDTPPDDSHDPCVVPVRQGWCRFRRPVLPLHGLDPVGHLAYRWSHPAWLVKRWIERLGEEETAALLEANDRPPRIVARVTRAAPSAGEALRALSQEGFDVQAGPIEGTLVLVRGGDIAQSDTLARGWIRIQDPTAIRIGAVLSPPEGARVLDLCSAPGGKAGQLLERVGASGHVVCVDRSEDKLAVLRENLEGLGGTFSTVKAPENPESLALGETFRWILVDAPCSNTGVLARRPDARWRLQSTDIERLAELQSGLLEAAWRHLAPGGRLLYATCSLEPEENEERVAALVGAHPELEEVESRQFLPHRTEGDGGFYSLLLRSRLGNVGQASGDAGPR